MTPSPQVVLDHWNRVFHPRWLACLEAMLEAHESRHSPYPYLLRIVGPTGVGKSELIEELIRLFPPQEDEFGPRIRILRVEIPALTTPKTLLIQLLCALGDETPTYGTAGVMEHRVLTLLKSARVELLAVDEVHHFVVSGGKVSVNEVSDMFKGLLNKARLPVVLIGARSSRLLFSVNSQLRSRARPILDLPPFRWDNPADRGSFLAVFKRQMPFGFDNDDALLTAEIGLRLWCATGGVSRQMRALGMELKKLSAAHKRLDLEVLSKAFKRSIWGECNDDSNPFHASFQARTLEKAGEPYEPDRIEGGLYALPSQIPALSEIYGQGAEKARRKRVPRNG